MKIAFSQMVFQKATTMEGTRNKIQLIEKKLGEYREKIGREIDEVLKVTVIQGMMDPETAREARRNKVEPNYEKMKGFVEELYHEERSREFVMIDEVKTPMKPNSTSVSHVDNAANAAPDPNGLGEEHCR